MLGARGGGGEHHRGLGVAVGVQVDADLREVVGPPVGAVEREPLDRGVEAGQTLLSVEHLLGVVALGGGREFDAPDVAHRAELLPCFPEDEGADRVSLQDAVDQLGGLLAGPDELPLELRDFYGAQLDAVGGLGVGAALGVGLLHTRGS